MSTEVRVAAAVVLALAVGFAVGWLIKPCPCDSVNTSASRIEVRVDTITKVIERSPRIISGRGRMAATATIMSESIESGADTICAPFTAVLDTIVNKDTIRIEYEHPVSLFTLMIRSAPDSIRYETKTVTLTNTTTTYEQRAWWIDALTHVGAASLGYAIGSTTK